MRSSILRSATLILALFPLLAPFAEAQDPVPRREKGTTAILDSRPDSDGVWLGGIYLWMISANGTASRGPATLPIDANFSDILDNLQFGGSAHLEYYDHSSRFGAFGDITVLSLESNLAGPVGSKVELDMGMYELVGTYRPASDAPVQFLFGVRVTDIGIQVSVPNLPTSDNDDSWADPLVGIRFLPKLTEDLALLARVDVGGFGVGSQQTWNLEAGLLWDISDRWHAEIAWRMMDIDYKSSNTSLNLRQEGPVVGLAYTF